MYVRFSDFIQSPNVSVQTSILYLLNQFKPFIISNGFFHKIGFNKYRNIKNEIKKIKINLIFFFKNSKKLIFFISINNRKEIKYCMNIKIPTNLMLTKKTVKKDSKRIRPLNSEVDRLLASSNRAKKILKWKPYYTDVAGFEKALKKTIDWYKKEENLSKFNAKKYNI